MSMLPLILMLAIAPPSPAKPPLPANVSYRVKRGDTLFDLATLYFVRPSDYRVVQRMNHVTNPRLMPVNKELRIPRRLLRNMTIKGEIVAFRGDVSILTGGRSAAAKIGSAVSEGTVLVTGAKAFVTVRLPDGSRVSMPSNSRVGVGRLRQTLLTQEVDRAFRLESGRSEWKVTPAKHPGDKFGVSTPIATAAVRGTEFRVSHDVGGSSTVSVVEGTVAVSDARAVPSDLVKIGLGIAVAPENRSVPTALDPAPVLEKPGAVQKDETIVFAANAVPGATGYVFELATDAGFVDRIAENLVPVPHTSFDTLPNGTYFVRASVLDSRGIQGLANTYGFDRRLNRVSLEAPGPEAFNGRKAYRFRWFGEGEGDVQYRFILARDEAAQDRVIDQSGLRTTDLAVTDLKPGTYYWQIWSIRFENGRVIDTVTPPQKFQIGNIG